eukprot:2789345-Pleurochrysis_carterae.AAC.1
MAGAAVCARAARETTPASIMKPAVQSVCPPSGVPLPALLADHPPPRLRLRPTSPSASPPRRLSHRLPRLPWRRRPSPRHRLWRLRPGPLELVQPASLRPGARRLPDTPSASPPTATPAATPALPRRLPWRWQARLRRFEHPPRVNAAPR